MSMTFEDAKKMFSDENEEKNSGKYADQFIEDYENDFKSLALAYEILSKYENPEKLSLNAEHDCIYLGYFNEDISEEDAIKMIRLGFHLDDDSENWAMFV